MLEQHWLCGRTDEAHLLEVITGWNCESVAACQHHQEIAVLKNQGMITTRQHWFPIDNSFSEAYALTNDGLARLREIGSEQAYENAVRMLEFYRQNELRGQNA